MAETSSSIKEVLPDIGGNFQLDRAIIDELPYGCRVVDASTHGTSAWTRTARIQVELADGSRESYFLKCAAERGHVMMEGEFNSVSSINNLEPGFAPRPYAWGKFERSDPPTWFVLLEFLHLSQEMVDPVNFCAKIAEMHMKSESPKPGMFGYHIPNCHGKIVQNNKWDTSWCRYFSKLINAFFEIEVQMNGPWPEYEKAFEQLATHTIPKVLEPLQAESRTLKPCLVHGDLWEENVATRLDTGEPVIFDGAVMYTHNEYELGMWRMVGCRFGEPYFRQYLRNIPPSEPAEQWEDRIRLYSIKFNLAKMIGWPGAPFTRERMYEDMVYLNEKYLAL